MRAKKGVETNLLNALLLSSHFLFLLDYFRFVFEGKREREADKEGGGRNNPHDVTDDLSASLYGTGRVCGGTMSTRATRRSTRDSFWT